MAPGMLGGLLFFPSFGFPGHPGMCQQSRIPKLTELGIFQASPTPGCSYRKAIGKAAYLLAWAMGFFVLFCFFLVSPLLF